MWALFWLGLSTAVFAAEVPSIPSVISTDAPETPAEGDSIFPIDSFNLPVEMLTTMQDARAKYQEGSYLIRTGEADEARKAFDEAVDLLLQSNWDLTSTPTLHAFFQDLIQRIQEDESSYLAVQDDTSEEIENAIVYDWDNIDLTSLEKDPSLKEALVADLTKTKYDIPITINEMVLNSLDFWLNQGRKCFIDGLQRSGQYRQIIEEVFREESIPLDLMYLAQVESLFKPNAVSKAKAKGIWQFGKGTAIRYGLKVTRDVDERSDPEKSTRAAARYLNDLFGMFEDWNLALAAYNWGEGKVQRLIANTGMKDFWQLVDLKRKVPEETKNHVPRIQASVILARNPEKYGLPVKLDPPLKYAQVSVSKPIDLRAAAKVLSTSIDELKKLNPSLRGLTTPANYPDFLLKIPINSDPNIHERLAALPRANTNRSTASGNRHKILRGETLSEIAARYRVSVSELARANNMSSKQLLIAGKWLQIPSKAKTSSGKTAAGNSASKNRTSNANTSASKSKANNKAAVKQVASK
jgi:membrane-bound lytic murein transglycosylase D